MKRLGFLSLALASCVAIGCSNDRTRNETNATTASGSVGTAGDADRSEITQGDKDFAHDLVIANMAEVELGKLAMERSTSADVAVAPLIVTGPRLEEIKRAPSPRAAPMVSGTVGRPAAASAA